MSRASVVWSRSRSSSAAARRPSRVVLVGDRRPEDAVEVGALVAERQLEDVAAVAGHDPLRRADERRRACRSRRGRRRSRSRRSARTPGRPAAARRATPRARRAGARRPRAAATADQLLVERPAGSSTLVASGPSTSERLDDAEGPRRSPRRRALADRDAVAERGQRRRVEHDLALLGVVLGLGELVDQRARPARRSAGCRDRRRRTAAPADGDGDLQRELDASSRRACGSRPTRAIASCIARPHAVARAVVAVEPAGDRVAAK